MNHPAVERTLKTGYPHPEVTGAVDYYGDEIAVGDEYAEFDGELILDINLQRFLKEELGFKFKKEW